MKTLEEHNAERMQKYTLIGKPHANNIACPQCGAELLDSNPGVTLASFPAQKEIHCDACGFRGYRIV